MDSDAAFDEYFSKFANRQVNYEVVLWRELTGSIVRLVCVHPGNDDYFAEMVDLIVENHPGFQIGRLTIIS